MTVNELNQQAKTLLETHFDSVEVTGEISKFTAHTSGHWYFTIKDERASVDCLMFKGANSKVRFSPKIGLLITISAKISLYTATGKFQLVASSMRPEGEGELDLAFRQLKERLSGDGLFDLAHKKPLPRFARRVALITSLTSAAYQDMLRVIKDRWALAQFIAINSLVQGETAPTALISALKWADANGFDAIVLARGGGSKEDLWCFNDEALARAIYAAKTPIISAVGHEIDFSISDFVADHRSLTPTAAMVDLLPDKLAITQWLDHSQTSINQQVSSYLSNRQNALNLAHLNLKSRAISSKIEREKLNLNLSLSKLKAAISSRINAVESKIKGFELVWEQKERFLQTTKNLIEVRTPKGAIAHLEDLKAGDEIRLISQTASRTATITGAKTKSPSPLKSLFD